jgi:hypothetical protein
MVWQLRIKGGLFDHYLNPFSLVVLEKFLSLSESASNYSTPGEYLQSVGDLSCKVYGYLGLISVPWHKDVIYQPHPSCVPT